MPRHGIRKPETLVVGIVLAIAVEHRDIDPTAFVFRSEVNLCRAVEKIRVKDDCAILSVGYVHRPRALSSKIRLDDVLLTCVVSVEVPMKGCIDPIDNEAAGVTVKIRFIRSDPDIDVDRRKVGVHSRVGWERGATLVTPHVTKRIAIPDQTRKRLAQFFSDLDEQRTVEPVLVLGPKPTVGVAVGRPHC